ncbi:MAG TPA: DUF3788 domain-containing protein [Anaerolineales bacterium]|nr:DUF3788 domain-containing protein [Anaerolineales bacterium]
MHERMMDKSVQPSDEEMLNWIGYPIAEEWGTLRQFLAETYEIVPIFNAGGKRYGWNLQYRLGGRPLCEMYPEHGSFTALVILGKAELEQALERLETFQAIVRQALTQSPRYHDGCWMYIRVSDPQTCQQDVRDIEELILIKRKPVRKKANRA